MRMPYVTRTLGKLRKMVNYGSGSLILAGGLALASATACTEKISDYNFNLSPEVPLVTDENGDVTPYIRIRGVQVQPITLPNGDLLIQRALEYTTVVRGGVRLSDNHYLKPTRFDDKGVSVLVDPNLSVPDDETPANIPVGDTYWLNGIGVKVVEIESDFVNVEVKKKVSIPGAIWNFLLGF